MSPSTDYTAAPTEINAEDYELPSIVPTKSAEQIEEENAFRSPPVGEQALKIVGFGGAPKQVTVTVTHKGHPCTFETYQIEVRMSPPGDLGASVTDRFLLPPADPYEQEAYFNGLKEGAKKAGFEGNKFIQFLHSLGFSCAAGQPLPDEARRLANWKNRLVIGTVQAGTPYPKTTQDPMTGETRTETKEGFPQIKLFTYRNINQAAVPIRQGAPAGQPSRPANVQPSPMPAYSLPAQPAPYPHAVPAGYPTPQPIPRPTNAPQARPAPLPPAARVGLDMV